MENWSGENVDLHFKACMFLQITQLEYTSLWGTENCQQQILIPSTFSHKKCPFTLIFLSVNTTGNISELTNARQNRYITENGFFNKTIERLEFPREFVISSLRRPAKTTPALLYFFSSCLTIFLSLTLFAETSLKTNVYNF